VAFAQILGSSVLFLVKGSQCIPDCRFLRSFGMLHVLLIYFCGEMTAPHFFLWRHVFFLIPRLGPYCCLAILPLTLA
jgi:hypothetical protein